MKRIGLVGLYSIDNMGDSLLCETTRYILEDAGDDVEVVEIDAAPRGLASYPGLHKLKLLLSALLIRVASLLFARTMPRSRARYHFERLAWRLKLQWHFKRIIPTCDAIIFAGGGFLKFKNQGLNYVVEQVVDLCGQHNIPVMLSAVGIEGFDSDDYRCRKLKSAISSPVIRSITTRDYLETLEDGYEVRAPTRTRLVGDSAFWATECYGIQRKSDATRVGVNLIREDIFQHYGKRLSATGLKAFYIDLLTRLDAQGIDWVLFSNGMKIDEDFGRRLLHKMGKPIDKMLSPPRTARELVDLISGFQSILGARMHACITAYALDVPAVGLIWNEKLTRFSEITRQRHMFFDEDDLNVETVCKVLLKTSRSVYNEDVRQEMKQRTYSEIAAFLQSLNDLKRGGS